MRIVGMLVAALMLAATVVGAQEGGTITGVVRAEGSEVPLGGARVSVAGSSREVTTSADGRFTLPSVPTGSVTVVVTRDGYAPLSQPVTVNAGQPVTLEVRLPAAPLVTERLTVVGRLSDYVEATSSASRTSAPLLDIPQAIEVLPARLLADIGAVDTKDLYKFMSGVTDSPYSMVVVRGFSQREVLVNGMRGNPFGSLEGDANESGFSTSQFRLSNIERVEVLKGPASVLYGSSEPGGVFNYVTKKPRDVFQANATFGTGQYSQGLAEAEVTGPANAARTILYRGAAYFERRDSFRFNASNRNVHAVGDLTWKPSPRSSLALEYEHIDQLNDGARLRGVPVDSQGNFLASYRWVANEPTDFTDLKADVVQLRFDHATRMGLRFDSTLRYAGYDRREQYHEPRAISGDLMRREFWHQLRTNDDWSWNANVAAPLRTTAAWSHDLSVGTDVFHQDHFYRFGRIRRQDQGGPVPPISLSNPVYGTTSGDDYVFNTATFPVDTVDHLRTGVYAQDLMSLGAQWNVLVGGRVDHYSDTGFNNTLPLSGDDTALTGRVGVVFKPLPRVSLYGSASNGFTRPSALSQTPSANGPHEPETSTNIEGGAKSEWLQGRVQFTGAVFRTVKRNVLRPDPDFGPTGENENAMLSTGRIRNQGVELDLAGQLLPRWNLAANYAFIDSEITEDLDPSLIGHRMPNAAPHKFGLFTRVDLAYGIGVGGSIESVAEREEPFAGTIAPGYTVVDAHYFQRFGPRLELRARLENMFNVEYAVSSLFAPRAGNFPGQPRTFSIALTVHSQAAP